MAWDYRRRLDLLWMTGFLAVISPTAGGFALGFLLGFSMPEAWRAVADAVAEGTTPVRTDGGSLLHEAGSDLDADVVGRGCREPGRSRSGNGLSPVGLW